MCTYTTERLELEASAKGPDGWTKMTNATVYFDHPVHFPAGHALLIDLLNPSKGPSARVALELSPDAARRLAEAILTTLEAVPSELLEHAS